MQFDEYQRLALRTMRPNQERSQRLANFALGLTGEAGETGDSIKKMVFHDHPFDPDKIRDELGDVLWYLAALASTCDLSLDEIADHNLAKLMRRYPQGFSTHDSLQRVDVEQD